MVGFSALCVNVQDYKPQQILSLNALLKHQHQHLQYNVSLMIVAHMNLITLHCQQCNCVYM